ncbi:MAG: MGMT family protein [Candidatus Helarchaeales archaeon]
MMKPLTNFEKRVLEITKRIPKGKVATYGQIARILGSKCARAVGNALAKNPYSFLSEHQDPVPCHRVVRSDGSLGGFMGKTSFVRDFKRELLVKEGIKIKKNRKIDLTECLVDDEILRDK